jgi:hypothetical protein
LMVGKTSIDFSPWDSSYLRLVFPILFLVQGGRWIGGWSWCSSQSTGPMLKRCKTL